MELSAEEKELHHRTVQALKGSERRMYMARVVQLWGYGGQAQAERALGWNRRTLRKGLRELAAGTIRDNFAAHGRKRVETRLPSCGKIFRPLWTDKARPIRPSRANGYIPA